VKISTVIQVVMEFTLEFPADTPDPYEEAKKWVRNVDRAVFKDEINAGAYDVHLISQDFIEGD